MRIVCLAMESAKAGNARQEADHRAKPEPVSPWKTAKAVDSQLVWEDAANKPMDFAPKDLFWDPSCLVQMKCYNGLC